MALRGLLLIGFFTGRLMAAEYYVDAASGNDSNSGTSMSSAWRSCAQVERFDTSPGFAAGDTVQFRRGQTFTNCRIEIDSAGLPGNPITIGAFGTGSRPMLRSTSGTVLSLSATSRYIRITGIRLNGGNWEATICLSIEAGGAHSIVDNVEVDHCGGDGICIGPQSGVTITNSDIHDNAGHIDRNALQGGIVTHAGNDEHIDDLTITNNKIRDNAGTIGSEPNGIVIGDFSGGWPIFDNLLIAGNDISGNGNFTQATLGRGITGTLCGDNIVVRDNIIRDNSSRGMALQETSLDHSCSMNITVLRNLFFNNNLSLLLYRQTNGTMNIYHNTFVTTGSETRPPFSIAKQADGGTLNIVNNIFRNDSGEGQSWFLQHGPDLGTVDYNIYFGTGDADWSDGAPGCDFACWQRFGHDANGLNRNMRFVRYDPSDLDFRNQDFSLDPLSPAIDAGLAIAGLDQGISGVAPDLGATEFQDGGSTTALCDLNSDSLTNVADVQLALNQVLGVVSCDRADLNRNGNCDVVDAQRFVNAAMGLGCRVGP